MVSQYRFTRRDSFLFVLHIEPNAISNAIGYAKFRSRSHVAVIRVYYDAGEVIQAHEHAGDSRDP